MLINDCLKQNPKERVKKEQLHKHLFFKKSTSPKNEEDRKKDEKIQLKNQLAAMKKEMNEMKVQSREMEKLSGSNRVKRRTLNQLTEEEEEEMEEEEVEELPVAQKSVVSHATSSKHETAMRVEPKKG